MRSTRHQWRGEPDAAADRGAAPDTPILTFINKLDREVRDPLDLIDESKTHPGHALRRITWPVGQGKSFGGIINLRTKSMTVFQPGSEKRPQDFETIPCLTQTTCAPASARHSTTRWRAWSWPWAHPQSGDPRRLP